MTCKLSVGDAAPSELGDQLAVGLENEDAAGFVVHGDDVAVLVHGHALRAQQTAAADLVLRRREKASTFGLFSPNKKGAVELCARQRFSFFLKMGVCAAVGMKTAYMTP